MEEEFDRMSVDARDSSSAYSIAETYLIFVHQPQPATR
jgi:hypothetical protein